MALTNTGGSRNQSVTIEVKIQGNVEDSKTYWITQDLPAGFAFRYQGSPVTAEDLQTMPEGDHEFPVTGTYAHLLVQFKAAVEALYDGLVIDDVATNEPYAAQNPYCPVTVGGGLEV